MKDTCPSAAAVDVMPPGKERIILQEFRRHVRFDRDIPSDQDRLALEVAKGGKITTMSPI